MKTLYKSLFISILAFFAVVGVLKAKYLWQYGNLEQRAEFAVEAGIVANLGEYMGSLEQNLLLGRYCEEGNCDNLGGTFQPIAGTTYNLAGSGISSSAVSITLQSLTLPQTGYKILDADLSSTFYLTLEPGNKTKQEIISCTTVVQNNDGTATLSSCTRGLLPISPYTASSTMRFAHAGGSQVIFSDPPQLFTELVNTWGDQTVTGTKAFASRRIRLGNNNATTTDACVYSYGGDANAPFVCYDEGTNKWLFSNNGVDTYDPQTGGSGLSASGTLAIRIDNSKIGIRLDDQNGGLRFYQGVPSSTIGIKFAPSGGLATSSGGIRIATSTALTWSATTTFATTTHKRITVTENATINGSTTLSVKTKIGNVNFFDQKFLGVGTSTNKTYFNFDIYFVSGTKPAFNIWDSSSCFTCEQYYNWAGFIPYADSTAWLISTTSTFPTLYFTNKAVVVEFGLKTPAAISESMGWGLATTHTPFYTNNDASVDACSYQVDSSGNLSAHTSNGDGTTNHTETAITGITLTNWNTYRIEFNPTRAICNFWVNGILKAVITTTLPSSGKVKIGFGASGNTGYGNNHTFITKPYFAVEK